MELNKIVSSIINDVWGGTSGLTANPSISYEQIEDEVVEKRISVIKELYSKNILNKGDLAVAINCIPVDCEDPAVCDNCTENFFSSGKKEHHFEIPLLIDDLGSDAIIYMGSLDHNYSYNIYLNKESAKINKYRRRGTDLPYVYINRTPNKNNMHDCWIYNAPFIKFISVIGVFKDLRQLRQFSCCNNDEILDFGVISDEVKTRVKKEKFIFYRENKTTPTPTDLIAK